MLDFRVKRVRAKLSNGPSCEIHLGRNLEQRRYKFPHFADFFNDPLEDPLQTTAKGQMPSDEHFCYISALLRHMAGIPQVHWLVGRSARLPIVVIIVSAPLSLAQNGHRFQEKP